MDLANPKFQKLVVLDDLSLTSGTLERLQRWSEEPVEAPRTDPVSEDETIRRLGGADAAIVSWRTPVTGAMIDQSQLRYIGLCASPYADPEASNIDLRSAARRRITVTALGKYSEEATAEFVLGQMLNAARNTGCVWRERSIELFGKNLGIIGLGNVGRLVADRAQAFGMRVFYTGRRAKVGAQAQGFHFLSMDELLRNSDVVTVHVPKGTRVLGKAEFDSLRADALLINTSIGPTFDAESFRTWFEQGTGAAICDISVDEAQKAVIRRGPNGCVIEALAADTVEMQQRKADQLIENIEAFSRNEPLRVMAIYE